MNGIALFDFDGTLIRGDSFLLFARTSLGGWRTCRAIWLASPWLVAWKLGLITGGAAKQRLFGALFGGCPEVRFKRYCHDFVAVLERQVRAPLMEQAVELRADGYQVAIVSASISSWIAPWARRHGIDIVIATEVEVDPATRRLTGRFSTPNCYGAEKVRRIRQTFGDIGDRHSVAFSDSRSDWPMLQLVKHGTLIKT